MRDVINKGVCEEELLESIEIAARQGYSGAKLYFMIGLPGERPEDLVGIVDLAKKALSVGKKHAKGRFTVTVSISPHVPKVQTPFQWEAQDESRLVEEKVRLLRTAVKGSPVVLKWRDSETAFLEGVFSRGDRRLGAAVEEAFKRGARFDGWTEHLQYETWMGVFADLAIDAPSYLAARDPETPQPWEHIESPVTRKFLWKERQKAYAAQVTVDCRLAFCHACGIDDCPDRLSPTGRRPGAPVESAAPPKFVPAPVALYGRRPKKTPLAASLALGTRFRLRYTKGKDLRFISHLELLRAWERTLRRSGLPLATTQGFRPHLKLAFGPPLPVGSTSIAEYLDLEFARPPAADLEDVLNALLPPGLTVTGWRPILFKTTSLMAAVDLATCRVRFTDSFLESGEISPLAFEDLLLEGISNLLEATTLVVRRQGGEGVKEFDARPSVESLVPLPGARALDVGIRFTPRAQARPDELVRLMFPQADVRLLEIERTGVYQVQGEERLSPFDLLMSAVGAQEANRATG
jgi:radical SAM-linked protein